MSELARRVASAVVLVPLVVWGVLALPTPWLATVAGAFAVAGAWEWSAIAGWPAPGQRAAWTVAVGLVLAALWPLAGSAARSAPILWAACAFWVLALGWVARFQGGREPGALRSVPVRLGTGVALLVPTWIALVALHASGGNGPAWVLGLLVLIWGADSGAYFVGRRFGRRRLADRVSPGKSVEGVLGGLAVVAVGAVAVALWQGWGPARAGALVALCLVTAAVSVLGDLAESMFKRRAGLKDSGTLIPGHGGVLDRIDSLTAAAPVFALGRHLLGLDA